MVNSEEKVPQQKKGYLVALHITHTHTHTICQMHSVARIKIKKDTLCICCESAKCLHQKLFKTFAQALMLNIAPLEKVGPDWCLVSQSEFSKMLYLTINMEHNILYSLAGKDNIRVCLKAFGLFTTVVQTETTFLTQKIGLSVCAVLYQHSWSSKARSPGISSRVTMRLILRVLSKILVFSKF